MQAENVIREKHAGDIEQLKFIFSDENRIIVTAPAGCGKTTAMVSKIARELSNGHILSNKKILAMTFSVNLGYGDVCKKRFFKVYISFWIYRIPCISSRINGIIRRKQYSAEQIYIFT